MVALGARAYDGGGFTMAFAPPRVVFGAGAVSRLKEEATLLGMRRALVLATSEGAPARRAVALLGEGCAGLFGAAAMHTPVGVTARAMQILADSAADGLVSVGGGSAIGLGKALAIRTGLRHLCVPTTYAGSEMTTMLGETEGGEKRTRRDPKILPAVVIYDPDLTASLPPSVAGPSGMNALAHAMEALYAPETHPLIALMAAEGIAALARALPRMVASQGADAAARAEALYGAWLSAACLGQVTMGLHHKLCHVLGGSFGLPHAETHAAVLPHIAAFNAPAAPAAMARVAAALGAPTAAEGLWALARSLGLTMSLAAFGLREEDLDRAAAIVTSAPYPNPRSATAEDLRAVLAQAWAGEPPAA